MSTPDIDDNSGVEALLGFEFQRNCALLLLMDNYESYSSQNYFISIEHYDDFLFGFRDSNNHKIEHIKSYQAKKLTGSKWTIAALGEPTSKMLDVGKAIKSDIVAKASSFSANLIFVSDNTIELKSGNLNKGSKGKAKYDIEKIRIDNPYMSYIELPDTLRDLVVDSVKSASTNAYCDSEFEHLAYQWVDLPKTSRNQLAILESRVRENFKGVPDAKAALLVLLSLFKSIEVLHNKRKKISLMDTQKILEGATIRQAVNVINLESKALDFWRACAKDLCPKVKLNMGKANRASEYIGIAFELFKDKNNQEHKKIFNFVKNNTFEDYCFGHDDTIEMFVNEYYKSSIYSNSIEREDVIFAIVCAYVQTRDIII
ncbi:DUF4297 domain-containing protein [Vibrio alginolyticus]|uniref:dsDNA nuclease domain-containing protein n=1 Tax=Vibrio harveyi group TaxID=717610 RepID=UPI000CE94022|nr:MULTISPECIES: dsDNA nuclease domain-containing protein [Vibrio harveyi group]AVF59845.1 hypothetical protein AL537_11065 [Vibrio diabolicus]MCS0240241.1 DUF4297 domain-containing protein [Vibrio alginolyticus]